MKPYIYDFGNGSGRRVPFLEFSPRGTWTGGTVPVQVGIRLIWNQTLHSYRSGVYHESISSVHPAHRLRQMCDLRDIHVYVIHTMLLHLQYKNTYR